MYKTAPSAAPTASESGAAQGATSITSTSYETIQSTIYLPSPTGSDVESGATGAPGAGGSGCAAQVTVTVTGAEQTVTVVCANVVICSNFHRLTHSRPPAPAPAPALPLAVLVKVPLPQHPLLRRLPHRLVHPPAPHPPRHSAADLTTTAPCQCQRQEQSATPPASSPSPPPASPFDQPARACSRLRVPRRLRRKCTARCHGLCIRSHRAERAGKLMYRAWASFVS